MRLRRKPDRRIEGARPALATRTHELDRIIDEYAHDAAVALQISASFTATDRHWVRAHAATSLPEVEKGAWRILALRQTGGIAGAAALLGMGHTSLGEWVQRRRGWRDQNGAARPSPPEPRPSWIRGRGRSSRRPSQ